MRRAGIRLEERGSGVLMEVSFRPSVLRWARERALVSDLGLFAAALGAIAAVVEAARAAGELSAGALRDFLLANASVHELNGRMESSLLGRNVKVSRDVGQPRAFRFMVGDNSEIGIL